MSDTKPTLAELEALLERKDVEVHILPSGELTVDSRIADLERELSAAQEARQAAEERAGLLFRLIETVMAIPTMTDEQLAELQRNCRAAIRRGEE